jgi:predicted dehydrogenase
MSLKVALIGCGKIADGHIEEIQKMPDLARVVATCDLEPLMAEQIAVRYGIKSHYGSSAEMLEKERPDVVHITTPPQSHLALARESIDAGCHVYVEKPLTLNYCDSKQLVDHALAAGRKLTIGYSHLYSPAALQMRDLVENGTLGDPVHVDAFFGYNLAGPFGTAILGDGTHWVHRLPGKLFHNNIDHLLYKATEFIDDERPEVHAQAYVRRPQRFGDSRDEMPDELRVTIMGRDVTFNGVFSSHVQPAAHTVRVYGTKNTITVDYEARTVTLDASAKLPSAIGRLIPPFSMAKQYWRAGMRNVRLFRRSDYHYFAGMNELMRRFYQSIAENSAPPVSYRDILRISSIMDEIFRQIDRGGKAN